MKQGSTFILKVAVFIIGAPVLTLAIFGIVVLPKAPPAQAYAHILYPILCVMYLSIVPFFIALYQAFRLLHYIDNNQAFSDLATNALKKIRNCAITISSLYVLCMPFFYMLAEKDDAPGVIVIGMIFVFSSYVITTFAAVLQRLLQEAIAMKIENDWTV